VAHQGKGSQVSKSFAVVYEGLADLTTATELADRVLVATVDWMDETLLDSQRQWLREDRSGERLAWRSIPRMAREVGIRVQGHFGGEPAMPDAHAARRAIAFILHQFDAVDAILLIRDLDDQAERRIGLEQARRAYAASTTIVIGVAIVERESWVISGFDPANQDERDALAEETRNLGFNPCLRSHELTAGKDNRAKKSPKRVLAVLTDNSWERQRACWQTTPLAVLEERGLANGLTDFLEEVRRYLAPLITGDIARRDHS
jgi:hypothetical protein